MNGATNLCELLVHGLDTEQTAEQEDWKTRVVSAVHPIDPVYFGPTADLELDIDVGALANSSHDVSEQLVSLAKNGVHERSHTNQTAWHRELEVVALGKERHDARAQRLAGKLARRVVEDLAGADLDLLADLVAGAQGLVRGLAGIPPRRPTLKTPLRILPPATPPLSSSTVAPGLLTSNDRMTISRGSVSKLWLGTGILVQMYSLTASMLYFSWAEMGMMGASLATVAGKGGRSLV